MKINRKICIILLSISIFTIDIFSQQNEVHKGGKILNKLIGTWATQGISRSTTDGQWKKDTTIATWIWYKILKDKAIQDDWYANTTPDKLDKATSMGTNIRIFNEKENKWFMGWIDTFNYKLLSFTATETEDTLTMEGNDAQGRPIRNVFSNITENSFYWVQQWTFDDGKSWVDVAKIWGKKWEKE